MHHDLCHMETLLSFWLDSALVITSTSLALSLFKVSSLSYAQKDFIPMTTAQPSYGVVIEEHIAGPYQDIGLAIVRKVFDAALWPGVWTLQDNVF